MSDEALHDDAPCAALSPLALVLRKKIGWLCQTIRFAALGWSGWIFLEVATFWSDRDHVAAVYARAFEYEPTPLADFNFYAGRALSGLGCVLTGLVAWALWKLFSRYLAGETFTVAAADDLRRLAVIGAATVAYSVAHRPLVYWLVSMGHDAKNLGAFVFAASDLLNAIFVTFLFSLAYIFKTAAELAEDHAQIV